MISDDELEALIRESGGVEVISGEIHTWGHLDIEDAEILEGGGDESEGHAAVVGESIMLRVVTGKLPSLRRGMIDHLQIDGDYYMVIPGTPQRIEGGTITRCFLEAE